MKTKPNSKKKYLATYQFNLAKDDFSEELKMGKPKKTIWEELKKAGRFDYSYQIFLKKCTELLNENSKEDTVTESETAPEKKSTTNKKEKKADLLKKLIG